MLVCYCLCILLMLAYFFLIQWENGRLQEKYGTPEDVHEGTAEGFVDITDQKQTDFRYTS